MNLLRYSQLAHHLHLTPRKPLLCQSKERRSLRSGNSLASHWELLRSLVRLDMETSLLWLSGQYESVLPDGIFKETLRGNYEFLQQFFNVCDKGKRRQAQPFLSQRGRFYLRARTQRLHWCDTEWRLSSHPPRRDVRERAVYPAADRAYDILMNTCLSSPLISRISGGCQLCWCRWTNAPARCGQPVQVCHSLFLLGVIACSQRRVFDIACLLDVPGCNINATDKKGNTVWHRHFPASASSLMISLSTTPCWRKTDWELST